MVNNPFETRFIRPGSIRYVRHGCDPEDLCEHILSTDKPLQIAGPHGSGKTTLTHELAKRLSLLGIGSRWITLRRVGRFRTPVISQPWTSETDSSLRMGHVTFVDGIETLTLLNRFLLLRSFSVQDKLIVTSHRKLLGIKPLCQTVPTLPHFMAICENLIGQIDDLWRKQIEFAFQNNAGNFREALFELYDQFENQQNHQSVTR